MRGRQDLQLAGEVSIMHNAIDQAPVSLGRAVRALVRAVIRRAGSFDVVSMTFNTLCNAYSHDTAAGSSETSMHSERMAASSDVRAEDSAPQARARVGVGKAAELEVLRTTAHIGATTTPVSIALYPLDRRDGSRMAHM
jgi:hypothetical protein